MIKAEIIDNNDIPAGLLICSPKNYEFTKKRWPKRRVVYEVMCDDKNIFYTKKRGGIFSIKVDDLSIWVPHIFPNFRKKFRGEKKNDNKI